MSSFLGNESRIQALVDRMITEAATSKGYGLSAIGTGLLIAFLRALAVILFFSRLVVWLCKAKQWMRLVLTMAWLAGVVELVSRVGGDPNGSFWHVMGNAAFVAGWIVSGLVMNRSVIREIAGLEPLASRKGDDHA